MPEHLVDAFNVFYADRRLERILRSDGPLRACDELAGFLRVWIGAQRNGRTATVVVDGRRPLAAGPPNGGSGGLTIIYAHGEADEELKRRLRIGRERRVLVSADHAIREVALASGSSVLSPAAFVRTALKEIGEELDARRAEATMKAMPWLEMFGGPQSFDLSLPDEPGSPIAAPAPRPARQRQPNQPPETDDMQSWVEYFKSAPERDAPPPRRPRPT